MQKFAYDMPTLFNGDEGILVFKIKQFGIESSMISIIYTEQNQKLKANMIEMYMPFRFRMHKIHFHSNELHFLNWDKMFTLVDTCAGSG